MNKYKTLAALVATALLATAGAMLVLAAIDAPYQRWNWMRKLKMTREELRREMKESEGSPEVKGRIRQLQQQMANRRMMEAVPTADVVVVNPTHYAVALKYEGGAMNAPTVGALGVDETALRIREVADGNKVAIVSAPPLARALYREGQLGKEIPVRLYSAVAQVLWMNSAREAARERPALLRLQHPPRPGNDPPGTWRAADRAGPAGHGRGAAGRAGARCTVHLQHRHLADGAAGGGLREAPAGLHHLPDRAADHHHAAAGAERGLHPRDPAQRPERP
ncbi:hypothetical protein G6F35_010315 [Rhizopus arrhizus]|nr:hypothetical protein G6F35_010315 [Rhizopus arrhizus]